ncbi:MAG TPA: hypothetical protein PKW98_00975 [Candidatus Wallbacteria bacterium]|nr:MAG: hypothetical protein BWY32_02828 [bacterium ADurb.Bin243]HPG56362.1 hypothetical protein [Candidatus Wallbacteria bacterium]
MKFSDRNDRGFFIGGADIACFIIINILMLASFGLGSSIRKTQDSKFLARQLEERRKQEEAEAARKRTMEERSKLEKNLLAKKEPPKVGAIDSGPKSGRTRLATSIVSETPAQFKKVITPSVKQPPVKQPAALKTETVQQAKRPLAEVKKTDEAALTKPAPGDSNEVEPALTFAERMSSLMFSDIDSLGVELYDYRLAKDTNREIAMLRLINAMKLEPVEKTGESGEYHLAVKTDEVALGYSSGPDSQASPDAAGTGAEAASKTGEINVKTGELAVKFLYKYKDKLYIATNAGLYFMPSGEAYEIKEGEKEKEKEKKPRLEKFMHEYIQPCDIIAMAGDGEFLFVGTPSTVYMIDLSGPLATDIGIDELFENSMWYSICYYGEKLYLANFEAIFYYDIKLARWFTVPYEKFAGVKKCRLQSLIVYQQPVSLGLNYMLVTSDCGVITDKMPSFDPAAFKYDSAQARPKILKKIFNRDLLRDHPAFVYDEPASVWFSFERREKEPYELIRYDKKTEKYDRYNSSEKLKCVYAIDAVRYNDNLMFAVNGEDLFAIIRMWGDNNSKVYGFFPIASIGGCFSVTYSDKFVICGTLDGRVYKIDASDIIKSVEKL